MSRCTFSYLSWNSVDFFNLWMFIFIWESSWLLFSCCHPTALFYLKIFSGFLIEQIVECVHLFFISQLFILHILFLCDPVISSTLSFYSKEWTLLQLSGLLCSGSGGCSGFSSLPCSSYVSSLIPLLVADLQYLFLTSIIELIQAKFSIFCDGLGRKRERLKPSRKQVHPLLGIGKANQWVPAFPVSQAK